MKWMAAEKRFWCLPDVLNKKKAKDWDNYNDAETFKTKLKNQDFESLLNVKSLELSNVYWPKREETLSIN